MRPLALRVRGLLRSSFAAMASIASVALLGLLASVAGCAANAGRSVTYACEEGGPLAVTYAPDYESLRLDYRGMALELAREPAASGVRYTDGEFEFRSRGREAMLRRGDQVVIWGCEQANGG